METLAAYIPTDRRWAIAQGLALPQRAYGAVLFADISGFTSLTDAFVKEFGPRRGAEEFPKQLNLVYETLIIEVHRYQGSVVNFSGDALTCWFDQDQGLRAVVCALQMQQVMKQFKEIVVGFGLTVSLALKVAITTGPVRRFQIGVPDIQYLDVLAGATVDRVALAEKHAAPGEIIVGSEVVTELREQLEIIEWRGKTGIKFAAITGLRNLAGMLPLTGFANGPLAQKLELSEAQIRPWLLTPIYEQKDYDQGQFFLAQIRPAVALFLRFSGIDYDHDEAADAKLDAYIRWVQTVVTRYGGYLIQLTHGDKGSYLYAAFGAPVAHDDDPVRAVASALDLRLPPCELSFITGVQIGLSRGQIRCGNYGSLSRCTYGVLGDEVIIAARLMEQAQPGQILVSQRVAQAAIHQFEFDYHGSVSLKGKAEHIHVFVALGQRQTTLPQWVAHFAVPPLGRERELGQLEQLLETAAAGHGQLARLEGAAGIGKSHLAATLVQRAPHHKVRPVTGRCQSADQHLAYIPWRQILRQLFLLHDLTPAKTQIDQITQVVTAMNPEWGIRLPLLGNLLGLPIPDNPTTQAFEPETRQESLFNFVADLLHAWARELPLLLVIEDAHWLDKMSLALILKASQTLSELPILLLLTHRPFDQSQFTDLSELAAYQPLSLPELTPDNITLLVKTHLKGEISPLALALIQAKAQGNPYFTRELAAELRESGRLGADTEGIWDLAETSFEILRQAGCLVRNPVDGQWLLRSEVPLSTADLGLPDSIEGLLLARFDRLPEVCRTILKTASVIGPTFEFEVLAHILLLDQPSLKEQLTLLQEVNFVRQELQISPPVYVFKHHLLQETVYKSLLSNQQSQLHQVVAEALEKLQPASIERLADHYRQGQVKVKALFYLDKAAQKMRRESAYEAARRYYKQALELEARWEWQLGQVEMLHILGQRDEERAELEKLQAGLSLTGESRRRSKRGGVGQSALAYLWGKYYEATSEYGQAQAAIKWALTRSRRQGDLTGEARCLAYLGLIGRRQGYYARAKIWYHKALALFDDTDLDRTENWLIFFEILNGLGACYRHQSDFDRAEIFYQQALTLSQTSHNRWGEALALDNIGTLAYNRRHLDEALAYHQQALILWRTVGDQRREGICLSELAQTARDGGDYSQADSYMALALKIHEASNDLWQQANIWNDRGGLYYELGELTRAQICLERGLELSHAIRDEAGQAFVFCNLGLVLGEMGQFVAAEENLLAGLRLAQKQKDEDLVSSFFCYLSLISLQTGRYTQAIKQARTALNLRRKLKVTAQMADDLATMAAAFLAMDQKQQALKYAQQSLAILNKSDGQWPEFPQRDSFICYQVLASTEEVVTAQMALQKAYDMVMMRANKISDPILRQSFLTKRIVNQQIVTEYRHHKP